MDNEKIYGLFKRDLGQRNLSDEERLGLFVAAQRGNQSAINKLVKDNTWLVIKIAWRYVDSDNPFHSLNDLIQEGCIGMLSAIEKFNPDKGKFSDYAGYWIRQKITIYLADNRFVTALPRHAYDLVLKYRRLATFFLSEHGHYPGSPEDVGFSGQESKLIDRAEKVFSSSSDLHTLGVNDDYRHIYLRQIKKQLPEICRKLLTSKELEIISLRWLDEPQPTQAIVAKRLGISKQAVRDREIRALAKLKRELMENNFR